MSVSGIFISNIWLFKILAVYIAVNFIFQYLIKTNKITPSKVSRIFYEDDTEFTNSWERIKSKGILMYIIKRTVFFAAGMVIIGIVFRLNNRRMFWFEQGQTIFVALVFGVVVGIIDGLIEWVIQKDRYGNLMEKVGNDKNSRV